MSIRDDMASVYGNHLLFLDPPRYDKAILGVVSRAGGLEAVAYDGRKILEILVEEDHMTWDEAVDFAEFSIYEAYVGENTPAFVNRWYGVG